MSAGNYQLRGDRNCITFNGQGQILSLQDVRTQNIVRFRGRQSVWRIVLRDRRGRKTAVQATAADKIMVRNANPGSLEFEWALAKYAMSVVVTVAADAETGMLRWGLDIRHKSGLSLWEAQYPRLGELAPLSAGGRADRLLFPWQCGLLIPDPVGVIRKGGVQARSWISEFGQCDEDEGVNKIAYNYPGMLAVQLLAFYDERRRFGLYCTAQDGAARFKRLGMYQAKKNTVIMAITHFPDERLAPNLDYRLPYPVVAGVFAGVWHDAAKLYRQWAIQQRWCAAGPVRERRDIPKWLKENDFWFWNWASHMKDAWNAMPEMFAPAAVALKKRLGCNVAVHWYGSNCEQFNLRNPEIFNLCKTKEMKLRKGLALLHKHGIHAIPYMNPRLCDPETETWQKHKVAGLACRTENGKMHEEVYIPGKPWVTICPTQKRWHRVILGIVRDCVKYGYDGVYIDQVSSCYAVPCFDRRHGHAAGGGDTWSRGNREMMKMLRIVKRRRDFAFTSESTLECYHDVVDANISVLATRANTGTLIATDNPVPLCQAIYHDYNMMYCSLIKLKDDPPDRVYLEGALNLVSGNQICFEQYTINDALTNKYADYLDYFARLCRFRKKYRPFFNFGEWEAPPEIKVKTVRVNLSPTRADHPVPAVLAGAWKRNGRRLVYAVNHTASEQPVRVRIDGREEEWRVPPRSVMGREIWKETKP